MKEQIRVSNLESLTSQPFHSTLNVERDIFMDQGQSEKPPRQAGEQPNKLISHETSPMGPFTKSAEKILDPQLRNYATSFQAKLGERQLGDWSVDELKNEYLDLHKLTSEVARKTLSLTGKEKAAAETQPYRELLTAELERKGADLTELFYEALGYAGETGKTVSVGATSPEGLFPDVDTFDPRLQPCRQPNRCWSSRSRFYR
jgi:hypothetical protein